MTLTKFQALEANLNSEIFERGPEIHAALNAILSRRHYFMIGPPGTAKSFLIRRLNEHIDHGEATAEAYFQWLLTKHSHPEELFGPPSLAEMQQGRYVRDTRRKLPRARFVFLDEIFKGNSSILNSLLTAANERLFFNGGEDEQLPLDVIFGASNEMPEDDSLNALWDRLHFRFEVKPLVEGGSFVSMLDRSTSRSDIPEKILTYEEVQEAQVEVANIPVGVDTLDLMKTLRDNLAEEGVEPTERRFVDCLPILQAEAWLAGRDHIDLQDFKVLQHVLWNRLEDQRTVARTVLNLADPIDAEAFDLIDGIIELDRELTNAIRSSDDSKQVVKQAVELHAAMKKVKKKMDELKGRDVERTSDKLEELETRFTNFGVRLMEEGFGQKT